MLCIIANSLIDNGMRATWPKSHLGQVVPVLKTGLRRDCDIVKRASKAGLRNDGVWAAFTGD